MMSSNVTKLNITVTHLMRLWMEKTGRLGSWSRDTLLLSNQIINIDNIINWRWIITNLVLPRVWDIAVI